MDALLKIAVDLKIYFMLMEDKIRSLLFNQQEFQYFLQS